MITGQLGIVGFGLATIGPGIATGLIFAAYISGVARQPEARGILEDRKSTRLNSSH